MATESKQSACNIAEMVRREVIVHFVRKVLQLNMLTVDLNIGLSSTVVNVGPARDCILMAQQGCLIRVGGCFGLPFKQLKSAESLCCTSRLGWPRVAPRL